MMWKSDHMNHLWRQCSANMSISVATHSGADQKHKLHTLIFSVSLLKETHDGKKKLCGNLH